MLTEDKAKKNTQDCYCKGKFIIYLEKSPHPSQNKCLIYEVVIYIRTENETRETYLLIYTFSDYHDCQVTITESPLPPS